MPPRSAPLPDPALVTKNDIGGGGGAVVGSGCVPRAGGCCAVARYEPPMTARVRPTPTVRVNVFTAAPFDGLQRGGTAPSANGMNNEMRSPVPVAREIC